MGESLGLVLGDSQKQNKVPSFCGLREIKTRIIIWVYDERHVRKACWLNRGRTGYSLSRKTEAWH